MQVDTFSNIVYQLACKNDQHLYICTIDVSCSLVSMRRDVRAGRRSTVGNRVGRVFVLEGSNPSLSATLAGKTGQTAVQGSVELLI